MDGSERCYIQGSHATWRPTPMARGSAGAATQTNSQQPWRETNQTAHQSCQEVWTLLRWAPKRPPVAIETWAIVNDVPQFIRATLEQLRAAIAGENWLAGNRSVRHLVDRLEQVGVKKSRREGMNYDPKNRRNRSGRCW